MKSKIITKQGVYSFTPIHLYLGRKLIDRKTCRDNLLLFKNILEKENIKFGIMFGTLLGAVRENNFIEHDEDTDVYVLDENRKNILNLLFKFKENGFEVARYEKDLLTIIKNDDYIDIYFFKKKFLRKRACMQYIYDSKYLDNFEQISFLDTTFNAPSNYLLLLEELYGKDWRTPKKNAHAEAPVQISIQKKLKKLFLNIFSPKIFKTNYKFLKQFNILNQQIEELKHNEEMFIIYGAGSISELISNKIKDKIVAKVDQKSNLISSDINKECIYSIQNIPNMKYDKIIISVLGREETIINFLTSELDIPENKIITFNLEEDE